MIKIVITHGYNIGIIEKYANIYLCIYTCTVVLSVDKRDTRCAIYTQYGLRSP